MLTIYDIIDVLPFDRHNWFGEAHKQKLSEFISQKNIKVILEVGSWMGGSTRFLAQQLPEDGYIIAVDHWKGDESIRSVGGGNFQYEVLYQQFLSNTIHENLVNKIVPLRMDSGEAALALKIVPDLLYLDAAHDEESVYEDLRVWWPKMGNHTIICGDDYNPSAWPGVVKAVHRFANKHGFTVKNLDGFWWFEKS